MKTPLHCCIALLLIVSVPVWAQKVAWNKDEAIQQAKEKIQMNCAPGGEVYTYCTENDIKGTFVIDFAVQGKGEITTVFMVSTSVDNITAKNKLKDRLAELKLKDMKIPKKERIKFRMTLNF